jgi:hypothetical protein
MEHHLEDVFKGLRMGNLEIAKFSMSDILEMTATYGPLNAKVRQAVIRKFGPDINHALAVVQTVETFGWAKARHYYPMHEFG